MAASPLADVRVVEEAAGLAASYAGFLLRELGADVVRLEPVATVREPGDHVLHRGKLAALGVTAALFARRRGAPGQRIDVSALAGAFALNSGTYVIGPDHQGSLAQHGDPRGVYPTYGLYPTADGWLFVGALTPTFWVKLMTALGREDLLAHPRLQGSPLTFGGRDVRALVRGELEPQF